MAVIIGSARIDENGKAHGGKAGDQTGKEVSTQNWYKHSKGWRVLRAKDPAVREKIAQAMQWACDDSKIGYDQWQRDTLYNAIKDKGFDIRQLDKAVETDCSALVRVCMAYAFGHDIITGDSRFSTANMCSRMLATGLFDEMTGSKYTDKSDYLLRGDVLCTKTQGHTVVVLSNGSKAGADAQSTPVSTTGGHATIRKGSKGVEVKLAQELLMAIGYSLPRYGADGDFGSETESAVKAFQCVKNLEVDGIIGNKTWAALEAAKAATSEQNPLVDVFSIQRTLHSGDKGEDVKALQKALMALGFELPKYGADGEYGAETVEAVKQMQKAAAIEVDGKFGDESRTALMAMLAKIDEGGVSAAKGKVRVTGGTANIRSGAGTQNKILTVVKRGTELVYTAQASNGWYAVQLGDGVGWISNKMVEVISA